MSQENNEATLHKRIHELEKQLADLKKTQGMDELLRDRDQSTATMLSRQQATEHELVTTKGMLEAAIAQSPSGVLIADAPDVTIRMGNSAAFNIRGGDQNLLTGIDVSQHAINWQTLRPDGSEYPPEQLPLSRAILEGCVTKNEEVIIRDSEGIDHWVNANAAPIYDANDRITAGIVVFHDITRHKLAQQELKKRLKYEHLLSEISISAITAEDLDVFQDRCINIMADILDVSRIYIFDYYHESNSMDNTFEWVAAGITAQIANLRGIPADEIPWWMTMMKNNDVINYQDVKEIPGEPERELLNAQNIKSILVVPLFVSGKLHGFIGFDECRRQRKWPDEDVELLLSASRIITSTIERKRAENELQKYQQQLEHLVEARTGELREANKEMEAFVYSVSHDLRTPLRAINGFTSILMEEYVTKLDNEGKQIGSNIQRSTRQMAKLIDDLLKFSRLGRVEMHPTDIDMQDMANDVYNELANAEEQKRIRFTVTDLPHMKGDSIMMRQVWTNIISNAIKFSGKRKDPVISITCQEEEDLYTYCIRDNGAGFDMQFSEKLFGVFERLHSQTEFEGTGVGLALVQRIVQRHGGKIWAEGEVNNGACVFLSFSK